MSVIEATTTQIYRASSRPRPSASCRRSRRGWMFVLSGLKTLLETGRPLSS
jgi:hypothetical protein